ncbi:MAG: hypothetical protein HFF72_03705 [Oscillospiraceae bacterium]|jgi:hypothetical protein|nr:hypothetical protein [Oscillospiraceae bacterium]
MRVSTIELLGKKYPLCFSLTAATEMEEAFGGLDKLSERMTGGSLAQQAGAINRALEILLKAGRVYASASGMGVPEPLPCAPADLIDVTDGEAVRAIFSTVAGDAEREVETVPNGKAGPGPA